MEAGDEDEQRKQAAKAAGLAKKAQALQRQAAARAEATARKQQAKRAEQEARAAQMQLKLRQEAEASTNGLHVQWDVQLHTNPDGTAVCADVWRSSDAADGALPCVLWLHGGGWKHGTHHTMPSFLRHLTAAGYAIVSVGYRKSTEAKFPACVHDCKLAVRYIRANSVALGTDGNRLGVVGNSAGAHLAALLGTTTGLTELEGSELG